MPPSSVAALRYARTLLLGTLALVGCGGSPSSPGTDADPDQPGPGTEVTCAALAPSSSSAFPATRVALGSVPSSFEEPLAAAISVGGDQSLGLAFVVPAASGGLELLVPIHPQTELAGGTIDLRVTDGTRTCQPFQFTIQPLPAAEGELAAIVDLLQDVVDSQAELFGTTRQQLTDADVNDLPPSLWPLVFVQTILDDPANPESLRAIADGDSGSEVLDWTNRLLAVTRMREHLVNPSATSGQAARATGSAPPARASAFGCLPDVVGESAQALSDCMKDQAEAKRLTEGLSAQVQQDIIDVFSTLSQIGLPAAEIVSQIFSWVSWLVTTERTKIAALYPSHFESMNVQVDRPEFMEDEDAMGKVIYADVFAQNLGYNLLDEIIDGVKQTVSLAEGAGDFDFSTGTAVDDAGEFQERISEMLEERLRNLNVPELNVLPELFGPVVVSDPMWIDARIVSGDAITLDEDAMTYEPRLFGESTISVRTADGEFGGDQIAEQVAITVHELMVTISPTNTFVAPSDPQNPQFETFEVKVDESKYPDMVDLDLSIHPEQGLAEIRISEGGDTHFVDYLAPAVPDYTRNDMLIVEHTATTGARANGPLRRAFATIRFGSIVITPRVGCIELGGMQTFSAEVVGPTDQSARWSASHGTIDEDSGEFTAPSTRPQDGLVTIRAESVEFDELFDEVTIPVGCTCQSTLTLAGTTITAQPGDQVYFTDWGGPMEPYGNNDEFFAIVFRQAGGDRTAAFPLEDDPGTWPTQGVGTAVRVQGSVGLSGPEILYASDDEFPAIITLSEYVPEMKARGTVTAGVTILSGQDPFSTPATLTWEFAVEVPPGYQRPSFPSAPYGYQFSCTVAG